MDDSQAMDIPIGALRPLRSQHQQAQYARILASIKTTGLIEPLIVFPEADGYVILDGVQRHRVLTGTWRRSCSVHSRKSARGVHRKPDGQPRVAGPREPHDREIAGGIGRSDDRSRIGNLGDFASNQKDIAQTASPGCCGRI
ncbi:MAG: ParB-like nuclease domain-containing protein [Planctomycetes bacterium]|nr:ParB-like nuclease domain-containing protein [Planctomycetota bacterium]